MSMRQPAYTFFVLTLAAVLWLHAAPACADFDKVIDSPMYRLPDLPDPPVEIVFPPELRVLWLRALERPEAEMRLKAAEAIVLAHRRGMKGLEETVAPLVTAFNAPDQDRAVRQAVAQALIALDARQGAPAPYPQGDQRKRDRRRLRFPRHLARRCDPRRCRCFVR